MFPFDTCKREDDQGTRRGKGEVCSRKMLLQTKLLEDRGAEERLEPTEKATGRGVMVKVREGEAGLVCRAKSAA